jgi:uncharacterized short protein YbdD (DUF466 family)
MRTERLVSASAGGFVVRLGALARRAPSVWRKVFGVPDYDAYVEHLRVAHPEQPPLGRGEFFAWALERKHGGRGPRCC